MTSVKSDRRDGNRANTTASPRSPVYGIQSGSASRFRVTAVSGTPDRAHCAAAGGPLTCNSYGFSGNNNLSAHVGWLRWPTVACVLVAILTTATFGSAYADAKPNGHTPSTIRSSKVSVLVFGDSTAFTLAYSLGAGLLPSKLHYSLQDEAHIGCGLPDNTPFRFKGVVYVPGSVCNSTTVPLPNTPLISQPLPVQWESTLAKYHPNVVVLLAGRWQVTDRLYGGEWTSIVNPTFAANAKQQLESASDIFTSAGANVVFMTTPCVNETPQPDGQPWPESDPARLAEYNALVRQVAAEHPTTDSVVDLDALVCPGGNYSARYKGVTIRSPDGIHFTDQAGLVLGRALMPPILSAGREQIARARSAR
jgi:hypothetical protein